MKNILVSIIVPVFQVEKYLEKCINSLIKQELSEIEILLINDGSTDNSGTICDKYALIDNRIKVFHIENSGAANARKVGFNKARGEYICFVDSDDFLPLDAIKTMYNYGTIHNLDIIVGGFNICYETYTKYIPIRNEIIEKQEYIKRLLLQKSNVGPCGKLYKRRLFDKNSFPSINRGEDFLMNLEISTRIQNLIGYINTPVYNYYQRNDSIMHLHRTDFTYEKQFNNLVYEILHKNNIHNIYSREFLYLSINQLYSIYRDNNVIENNDEWINKIIKNANEINLTLKEKIIIFSIKYPKFQHIIYIIRIFYNTIKWGYHKLINFQKR